MDPVIPTKHKRTRCCDIPLCAACQLGKMKSVSTGHKTSKPISERNNNLKKEALDPGAAVSVDQYQTKTPGRLPLTYGKEKEKDRFNGGTIYVDHSTKLIKTYNQVSLRAGETLVGKDLFERFARENGIKVRHYHGDNGVFASKAFKEHCRQREQTVDFSGTGAHHQNAVAERAIQTVTYWARAMVIHAALRWPDQANKSLWPFALDYAVWLYNRLPSRETGYSPLELWSRSHSDHSELGRAHVWGCPCYRFGPQASRWKEDTQVEQSLAPRPVPWLLGGAFVHDRRRFGI